MKQVLVPFHWMDKKQDSGQKAAVFQQNVEQLMTMVNNKQQKERLVTNEYKW